MNKKLTFSALVLLLGTSSSWNAAGNSSNDLPVLERQVMNLSQKSNDSVSFSVPLGAITTRDGIPGVFVVENNEARFRMVRPGKRSATRVEILSGLFGNEVLVIGELAEVHDGSPITISTKKKVR